MRNTLCSETPFIGPEAFGAAYAFMLARDTHAEGSVDRELFRTMIGLRAETADRLYGAHTSLDIRYQAGARPELARVLAELCLGDAVPEVRLSAIAGQPPDAAWPAAEYGRGLAAPPTRPGGKLARAFARADAGTKLQCRGGMMRVSCICSVREGERIDKQARRGPATRGSQRTRAEARRP